MNTTIPQLNVCLNNRVRRYRPDSPLQNWRELGVHGTRQEIVEEYNQSLELRYAQGEIKPEDLIDTMDNIEPCRCRDGLLCTTGVLDQFLQTKLEHLTTPQTSRH